MIYTLSQSPTASPAPAPPPLDQIRSDPTRLVQQVSRVVSICPSASNLPLCRSVFLASAAGSASLRQASFCVSVASATALPSRIAFRQPAKPTNTSTD
ncbi:unnamed protein product [Protopolystoma xenopodis]|uniref:Uncharacterized protein n=1 Tax=Protopolystoma xenopodis TaxID=117903 RepID=A0A3S5CME2_9PLAT|nr:unnamed protein product [Protopolystoma xenopodis]